MPPEVEAVESEVAADYTNGDVIKGTSGARKIHFAIGGKVKSGVGRAIYVAIVEEDTAYMLMAYRKSEQEDLSDDDRNAVKDFIVSLNGDDE